MLFRAPRVNEVGRLHQQRKRTPSPLEGEGGVRGRSALADHLHLITPCLKSFSISRAALAPGAPMTPPPGWVPEPHM